MSPGQRLEFFEEGEQLPGGFARSTARFQFGDDVSLACDMKVAFRNPELGLREMRL